MPITLAESSMADKLQAGRSGLWMSSWPGTVIPRWQTSSSSRVGVLKASAFSFVSQTVCFLYPTLNLRQPSFSSRRCTVLEQSSAAYHICSDTSHLLLSLGDMLLCNGPRYYMVKLFGGKYYVTNIFYRTEINNLLFVSVSLIWSTAKDRAEYCVAGQEASARTPATRSTSSLTTAHSVCHVEGTAAPCRGKYPSAHRSVNSIATQQLNTDRRNFRVF